MVKLSVISQYEEVRLDLGFDGKGCIHPRQIAVVHRGFAPPEAEIDKAKRIVLAFDEAERQGLGVVSLGSKMIDPPVVESRLAVGSSARIIAGSATMARATATRCCWPPTATSFTPDRPGTRTGGLTSLMSSVDETCRPAGRGSRRIEADALRPLPTLAKRADRNPGNFPGDCS